MLPSIAPSMGPRTKEVSAKMKKLRKMLLDIHREIDSSDDWTRLHLDVWSQSSGLDPKLLPPVAGSRAGGFAEITLKFASYIEDLLTTLPLDRGGRQNHEEQFLGTAKTNFVREAL